MYIDEHYPQKLELAKKYYENQKKYSSFSQALAAKRKKGVYIGKVDLLDGNPFFIHCHINMKFDKGAILGIWNEITLLDRK